MENKKDKECGCHHDNESCGCEHDQEKETCNCEHEHHHDECGCHHEHGCCEHEGESEYCEGDYFDNITLVDQETKEEFEVAVLFQTELDGKEITYVCHGDFEDESQPLDVYVLEEIEPHEFQMIDIDSDSRLERIKEIYEEWQASVYGADSDPDDEVEF